AFYRGVAIILWRAIRREPASMLILAWLGVMSLPCILSEEAGAYTLRAMGMVPAMYFLPAVGLVAAWEWLEQRRNLLWVPVPAAAGAALIALVLASEAGLTYHDYFQVWAHSFGGAYEDGADMVAASRYLQQEARPNKEEIIVGSEFLGHPVAAQLAPRVYDALRWVDGNKAMVYRTEGERDTLYVFPYTTRPWMMDDLLPPETEVRRAYFERGIDPDQPPPATYTAYRLSPAEARAQIERLKQQPGTVALDANLGDQVAAISGQSAPRVVPGSTLPVTALWRILASPGNQDYVFFSHLVDNQGRMWAQYDENGYPVAQWQSGEVLATRLDMPVGTKVAPGRYRVEIGVYDRRAGVRLPLVGQGQKGSTIILGSVKVAALTSAAPPQLPHPLDIRLGEHIRLLGFDAGMQPAPDPVGRPRLAVTIAWQAADAPPADYTVFVQLLNADGQLVAQADAMPQGGLNPTGSWEAGETVVDEHTISLPPDLPPGRYRLIAGMYLVETGERLPVAGGDNYVSLTTLDLTATDLSGQ
ncbi:MAG: hypothetical protein M1531_02565, partial [Chloroflexi bacterium]|nr:hypothetical protein [Chloroflexota bacterium]